MSEEITEELSEEEIGEDSSDVLEESTEMDSLLL